MVAYILKSAPSDFNFLSFDLLLCTVFVLLSLDSTLRNVFTEQAFLPWNRVCKAHSWSPLLFLVDRWLCPPPLPTAAPDRTDEDAVVICPTCCYLWFHWSTLLPNFNVHVILDFIILVLVCICMVIWGDWEIFHDYYLLRIPN